MQRTVEGVMGEKPWDELTDQEKIERLCETAQKLALRCEALRSSHIEQADRIKELEERLETLESHQP